MTDIDKYEQLRKVISEKLQALGFKAIDSLVIRIEENRDTEIEFTIEVTPGTLLSTEDREMHADFDSIISGLEMDDKTTDKIERIEYDADEWDI